jgi:UDPglucose 6-dehydrogenase
LPRIIVVGAGIVGQAAGKGLIKKGHEVIFIDNNLNVIDILKKQGFTAYTQDNLPYIDVDISMFCVPTPYTDGITDLSHIISSVATHGAWLRRRSNKNSNGHVVVIKSTVPPFTTRTKLLPLLELCSKLKVGKDIGLCVQPEFLRTKSAERDFLNARINVIGEFDKSSGDCLESIYSDFGAESIRVDLETAEFTKYVHNCFNAAKISFANEIWLLGRRVGIDANSALQIAVKSGEGFWNPSYGTLGGEPYNGSCLPKDVKAFLSFAKEHDFDMPVLRSADLVNSQMKDLVKVNEDIKSEVSCDSRHGLRDVTAEGKFPAKKLRISEKGEHLIARF